MNYDQARQVDPKANRPDAGKWRYTSMNDGNIHPIGYCASIVTCPICDGRSAYWSPGPRVECPDCNSRGYNIDETRCPGHDTSEEADRHYYEWQADHLHETEMRPSSKVVDGRFPCEARIIAEHWHISSLLAQWQPDDDGMIRCGRPTTKGLGIVGEMMDIVMLCDEHRNKDGWMLARPFKAGIVSIHS